MRIEVPVSSFKAALGRTGRRQRGSPSSSEPQGDGTSIHSADAEFDHAGPELRSGLCSGNRARNIDRA